MTFTDITFSKSEDPEALLQPMNTEWKTRLASKCGQSLWDRIGFNANSRRTHANKLRATNGHENRCLQMLAKRLTRETLQHNRTESQSLKCAR